MPVRNHFRMSLMRWSVVLLYNPITLKFGRSTAYELGLIFLCLVYGFYILTTRVVTAGLYLSNQNKLAKLTRFFSVFWLFFWLHVYSSARVQWKKYSPLTHRRIFTEYCGLSALRYHQHFWNFVTFVNTILPLLVCNACLPTPLRKIRFLFCVVSVVK